MGFPGGSEVKASAWNVGDPGSIPGSGRSPGEGKWQPTPVLLPGESHPWDTTDPFPSPGDLPDPGTKPGSPTFQADALTSEPIGKEVVK